MVKGNNYENYGSNPSFFFFYYYYKKIAIQVEL